MDPVREIEGLVAFQARGPGTDAERRAARHLASRLAAAGRDVAVDPIRVRPSYAATHALHALLAAGASVVSVSRPAPAAAVLAVITLSALGDLTGRFYLLRRLTGRRASQNVTSREGGDKPGTLVLVAHYDVARTGAVFSPRALRRRARLGRLIRRPIGPFEVFFWSLAAVLVCAALRVGEVEGLALSIAQFVPTVVLIVSVALLADVALSGFVPGAADNASGVATVLRLADRYGEALEHFDLWVLFPGAEEGLMLGMREWMRAHRGELRPDATVFLNLDKVASGAVRYTKKEGFIVAAASHPQLVGLCREIAAGIAAADAPAAEPVVLRSGTAAHPARQRGFPAITISCLGPLGYAEHYHQPTDTPERVDRDALEAALDFCCELIERLDEEIGPALGDAPESSPAGGGLRARLGRSRR